MGNYDLRQWLFGLLIECPMGKPVENCPFNEYRKEPTTKKISITYEMPREKVMNLIIHHKKCLAKRESMIAKKELTKKNSKK